MVTMEPLDKPSVVQEPEQLQLIDLFTSLPLEGLAMTADMAKKNPRPCFKLQFNLGALGPRLRAYAERHGSSMAVLVRRATRKMLDDEQVPESASAYPQPFEHSARNVPFHLNLPAAYAAELTARARAADMTRGEFVWSLLKGISPPALPPDHAMAVQALRASTDLLAAMSTDLSEVLRLITRVKGPREELAAYRARMQELVGIVLDHLKVVSVLIEELTPYRRARW